MSTPLAGDTIFALSSGAAPSAIAIVRVSGPEAGTALKRLARRLPEPRRATRARVRATDGSPIDHALLLWFPGPASATGEDVAEFHLHGGRAVVAALLDALAALPGLRPALPGEFTRRAFLTGRIDLTAAEGLADLLEAETADQHARAMRLAEGGLTLTIEQWRTRLLDLSAQIEAAIEFGESEDDVGDLPPAIGPDLAVLTGELAAMLALPPAERLRDGYRIVIAGPANSGKSSIINALVGRDVALATPVPGTTRDIIEAPVRLGANAVLLTDTAGLHDSDDPVERLGIARAYAVIDDADLILWCGEAGACPDPRRSMVLFTRADARTDELAGDALPVSIHWPASLAALRAAIDARCMSFPAFADRLVPNLRQRALVQHMADELAVAACLHDPILIAEHLRQCRLELDALTGRSGVEDVLDALFGRFCIGK